METLTHGKSFRAPVGRVFAMFTGVAQAPTWMQAIKEIEVLRGTGSAVGDRWRELRRVGGREQWMEFVVTEWTLDKSWAIESEAGGTLWTTHFTFAESLGVTEIAASMQWQPKGIVLRLFNGMIRRRITEGMEMDCEDLRKALEEKL